jgi:type IX secretion system substrate protein
MKKISIYLILLLTIIKVDAQTLIATSNSFEATANHNQRKIVRDSLDNVFVIYVDSSEQGRVIKGLWLNNEINEWSSVTEITKGTNPSLSINKLGKFNLLFESNDSVKIISQISSTDFFSWTNVKEISDSNYYCHLPICDSDSSGNFNMFWIKNSSNSEQTLMYANIINDNITNTKAITTKSVINDIAIANHLQNYNDDLIFSIQFNEDSLQFFRSINKLESIDTLYKAIGTQPCITFNAMIPHYSIYQENPIRFLYLNNSEQLVEVECGLDYYNADNFPTRIIEFYPIEYICIDDIAPPIGYSYLYMKNNTLFHGFSYGADWQWSTILDTVSSNPINPSLAYKNFNALYVDYVWMQRNSNNFDIYYKRDEKNKYLGKDDNETGKGFSIVGYPNPFKDKLNIEIDVDYILDQPLLEIYDIFLRKITILQPTNQSSNKYYYTWETNKLLSSGLYFIKCSVGSKTTIRKVICYK